MPLAIGATAADYVPSANSQNVDVSTADSGIGLSEVLQGTNHFTCASGDRRQREQ